MTDPRTVAAKLRLLADHLVIDDLTDEQWGALDQRLADALGDLPADGPDRTRFARAFDPVTAPGELAMPTHSIAQGSSAIIPPLDLVFSDDDTRLVVRTTVGSAWEGPPGLVHGGFVAATFDMGLSALATRVLAHSVTRWIRVRYLKPTTLGSELRYELEVDGSPEGRLLDLRGTLYADDRVTARATAQFAVVDSARFGHAVPSAGDSGQG